MSAYVYMDLGWRPAFKLYNAWVALIGSAICVAIMFIINWYFALVTIFVVAVLYKLVDFLKPGQELVGETSVD